MHPLLRIICPSIDVCREIPDAVDVILRRREDARQNAGRSSHFVWRPFQATIEKVEPVDIDIRFHPLIAYGKAKATPCGVALPPNRRGWGVMNHYYAAKLTDWQTLKACMQSIA